MTRILLALACATMLGCGDDATSSSCCKTCTKGKPCGDSCIEANQTCNKGAGCACKG
jgi:hypothetical protein